MEIQAGNRIMKCLTFKSKNNNSQCNTKALNNSNFCGRHRNQSIIHFNNDGNLINHNHNNNTQNIPTTLENIPNEHKNNYNILKQLDNNANDIYNGFLMSRKMYIIETPKYIDITEYLENSKIDNYQYSRIIASLEYYKLIKNKNNEVSKFMLVFNHLSILQSFFETLLSCMLNLDKIIKLQKWIKKSIKLYNTKIRGVGYIDRTLCVNDSDFVSLDNLKDIPDSDFISFCESDSNSNSNFDSAKNGSKSIIYGFNIDSIIELILKSDDNFMNNLKLKTRDMCYRQYINVLFNHYNKIKIYNPYTRFIIPGNIKLNIIRVHAQKIFNNFNSNFNSNSSYNSIMKKNNQVNMNLVNGYINDNYSGGIGSNTSSSISINIKTYIRNKCFSVLQKIDMMGYFTNILWILDEQPKNIKLFYKKLASLWMFEFGLDNNARYKISQYGVNLFQNLNDILTSKSNKYIILDKILDVMDILVSNGESESDKNIGCILILYAISYINPQCIDANPWILL